MFFVDGAMRPKACIFTAGGTPNPNAQNNLQIMQRRLINILNSRLEFSEPKPLPSKNIFLTKKMAIKIVKK